MATLHTICLSGENLQLLIQDVARAAQNSVFKFAIEIRTVRDHHVAVLLRQLHRAFYDQFIALLIINNFICEKANTVIERFDIACCHKTLVFGN